MARPKKSKKEIVIENDSTEKAKEVQCPKEIVTETNNTETAVDIQCPEESVPQEGQLMMEAPEVFLENSCEFAIEVTNRNFESIPDPIRKEVEYVSKDNGNKVLNDIELLRLTSSRIRSNRMARKVSRSNNSRIKPNFKIG